MPTYPELRHIANAIEDGSVARLPLSDLAEMNATLVSAQFMGPERQIDGFAETVRQNITRVMIESLQTHITSLNKANGRTQTLVVCLTIASLIGSGFQIWYGYKADRRAEAESAATEARQPSQKSAASNPSRAQPQTSSPATAIRAAAASASAGSSRK